MRLAVVGAGGHAKVVLDAIQKSWPEQGISAISGFIDEFRFGHSFYGHPVVESIEKLDADTFVIAVGDNQIRKERFQDLTNAGYRPITIIHPAATLASDVTVGLGSVICAGAIISAAASIGNNVIINTGVSIDHDCIISDHSHIAPGSVLAGEVQVGEGAFLGIGTKVIPKIRLAAGCITGAGAVVITDVPTGVTVVGVPAKPLLPKSR